MSQVRPRNLDAPRVRRLLSSSKRGERLDRLSALLLGSPYAEHPLVGSAETPEVFTARLDAFDCVTYVEAVLALARASGPHAFADQLRRLRYRGGRVSWTTRNHYMTSWIAANAREGLVRPLRADVPAVRKERTLDAVPGLRPLHARFSCVPKRFMSRLEPHLSTGDLIFFVSTKPSLDVFHCGMLVKTGDGLRMRHAARSRGSVVEQDLTGFLKANRTAGVIVVRPVVETGR